MSFESEPAPCRILDTRGSYCPQPVIDTDAAMRELAPGQVLEILADDVGVRYDLPAWCSANRQQFIGIIEQPGLLRVRIKKAAPPTGGQTLGEKKS